MKKAYINPAISNVLMDAEDLLGASQNPDGFNGVLDEANTISTDEMLSRRRNVWDDNDMDEEF